MVQVREALQRLADKGLRLTQQRHRVVAQVYTQDGHFDAEDLARSLASGKMRASRATIYRLLPLLVEVGLLREVMPFGNRRCYELVKPAKHHEHFICEHCGEVIEFQDAEMEEAIASAARKHGFQMYRHSVEILGACPRCAKAQAAAEGEKVP